MKRVLDPLAQVPGVRRALLVSRDGVPVATLEGVSGGGPAEGAEAFAGLVAGLAQELSRAVDPLSWDRPRRVVLRAARGTLVLCLGDRLSICVDLERGMTAEDLSLPLQAVEARLARELDPTREASAPGVSADPKPEPPGLFPGGSSSDSGQRPEADPTRESRVPETTTDS